MKQTLTADMNCLSCRFEPNWPKWSGNQYPRTTAKCRYEINLPPLPSCFRSHTQAITRYKDNSGIETHCPTWETKL